MPPFLLVRQAWCVEKIHCWDGCSDQAGDLGIQIPNLCFFQYYEQAKGQKAFQRIE